MTFFFIILWYFFQNVATNCHLSLLFQKLEVSILTLIFKICSYLSLNQKQKQNQATKLQGVYSSDNAEEKPNLILYKDFLEAKGGIGVKIFCGDWRNKLTFLQRLEKLKSRPYKSWNVWDIVFSRWWRNPHISFTVSGQSPLRKIAPRLGLEFWLGLVSGLGGNYPRGQLS